MPTPLQIPEQLGEGFEYLLEAPPDRFSSLIEDMRKAGGHHSKEFFIGLIKDTLGLPKPKANSVLRVFTSLFNLSTATEFKANEDEFLNFLIIAVDEAIDEQEIEIKEYNKELFKRNLQGIFTLEDSIGTISRISNLLSEYDKRYVGARIVTDIRPSFKREIDPKDEVEDVLIVHQLRVIFHSEDEKHHEIYIALDGTDLEDLKNVIERAAIKEQLMTTSLTRKSITPISTKGIHNL
jgi:hypothetical protein